MKVLLANPSWEKNKQQYGIRAGSRWPFTQTTKNQKSLNYIPFPFFLVYAAELMEKQDDIENGLLRFRKAWKAHQMKKKLSLIYILNAISQPEKNYI